MPKTKCSFSDNYSKEWNFILKMRYEDEVDCKICKATFSIAHSGRPILHSTSIHRNINYIFQLRVVQKVLIVIL